MEKATRIVWPRVGVVEIEEFQVGEPGPTEVLIKTLYTLISPGTELAFLHALPNTQHAGFPQRPGYNYVGRIVAVGAEVTDLNPGDLVIAHKGHASMARAAANEVLSVPEGVDPRQAVYSTMAAISMQAVRKAQIELGEAVAVLGQGIIGNLAGQLARLSGALPTVAIDLVEWRLSVARACGADMCINPGDGGLEAIRAAMGRPDVDVVLEATGAPEAVHDALALAGYRGRVVLLASTRGVTKEVNFYSEVHRRGIVIIGAHNAVRPKHESSQAYWTQKDDWDVALRLMATGRLEVSRLTTDILPASEAAKGYELLRSDKAAHLGVLLDWSK
ncbi:MAG: zinc-binding alcohol dehydrogenase [Chloroflexi bacterium]|nr:zinc-binding alcohol dehydrogenase [Chloroflexota bacterium]